MASETRRRCAGCGCALSRYNRDDRCAACARVRQADSRPLARVPQRVWRDDAVQEALSTRDFGTASRLIRRAGSLRQEDIAALTGLSQSFLSMLESGRRRLTKIENIQAFATGLQIPEQLVRVPLMHVDDSRSGVVAGIPEPPDGDLDPALPWTAGRMVASLNEAARGGVMDRRGFLAVGGIALTAHVHHWGTAEMEPIARAASGSRVSAALVDHLQGTIDHLRVLDAGAGSGSLADLASAHLSLLLRILEKGSYSEAVGRKLAAVAAEGLAP